MRFPTTLFLKAACFLALFCGYVLNSLALDREAFSISNYDLTVQVDPAQHRLGVRGKITLCNDTASPQKIAVLQISSSLDWRSIKAGDKSIQFVTQPYASDIDHTGELSEAIVTLPQPVESRATLDLAIAYEGVITPDASRLTRIGTPEEVAKNTDWDTIGTNFTAVRGAGYVAWYPIATEVANLSQDESLFEVLGRWKMRESNSTAHVKLLIFNENSASGLRIILNQPGCSTSTDTTRPGDEISIECRYESFGSVIPTFLIAPYGVVDRPSIEVFNLSSHAFAAEVYARTAEKVAALISDWFGTPRHKPETADLPDSSQASFETGSFLITSLSENDFTSGLSASHQLTHASFSSFRLWIEEGMAHFAQALYVEQQKGRRAALDYMGAHRAALIKMEQPTITQSTSDAERSLVNTTNDEFYRSKAMCVWWMLRDMIGDSALKKTITAYRPELDKEPSYMPRLIAAQTQRDLEWFFDDWVYRDRGLPEFKVESAYSRKTMTNAFILTVTVDNLGAAGAEVPILVKFAGGETTKRLEVRGKNKASVRIETPGVPQEITVNDGSVPESKISNNKVKIEPPQN